MIWDRKKFVYITLLLAIVFFSFSSCLQLQWMKYVKWNSFNAYLYYTILLFLCIVNIIINGRLWYVNIRSYVLQYLYEWTSLYNLFSRFKQYTMFEGFMRHHSTHNILSCYSIFNAYCLFYPFAFFNCKIKLCSFISINCFNALIFV